MKYQNEVKIGDVFEDEVNYLGMDAGVKYKIIGSEESFPNNSIKEDLWKIIELYNSEVDELKVSLKLEIPKAKFKLLLDNGFLNII